MIRIRLGETVFCAKRVYGYPAIRRIVVYDKDDRYTVALESSQKVEELMYQACERGFIDFTKEKIEFDFE